MKQIMLTFLITGMGLGAAGCVQLKAPKDPIVINLNVKIDQEVRVRLEGVAEDIIDENPDLF
jgi:hypothetical protein